MSWSIRLGRLFGIPVNIHVTFLLLLGFVGLTQSARGGLAAGLYGVIFISAIFGCVVLHEMGHALAARAFGIGTRDVTLLPIGGVARLERMPRDPRQELIVALAGPAVNLAIAGVLALWVALTSMGGSALGLSQGSFASRLLVVNIGLVLFNLLPAFPMDGGRVLRALLAQRIGHLPATELAATIGRGMAILFGIGGLFLNPMLFFIALFVWFGATQEVALARAGFRPGGRSGPFRDPRFDPQGPGTGGAGPVIDVTPGREPRWVDSPRRGPVRRVIRVDRHY